MGTPEEILENWQEAINIRCSEVKFTKLKELIRIITGAFPNKSFRSSRQWKERPLSLAHIQYARNDSHFLIPCYFYLMKLIDPSLFPNKITPSNYTIKKQDILTSATDGKIFINNELFLTRFMHEFIETKGINVIQKV